MKKFLLLFAMVFIIPVSFAATPVFYDDFESEDLSHAENGFSWDRKGSGGSSDPNYISNSANWPNEPAYGGQHAMRIHLKATSSGQDVFQYVDFRIPGNNLDELWIEFMIRIPDNYYHRDDVSSDNNKFFQLWSGGRGGNNELIHFVPSTWITKVGQPGESRVNMRLQSRDVKQGPITYGPQPTLKDPFPAFADRGKWRQMRWHIKLGTVGQNNGQLDVWIDGKLEYSSHSLPDWHAGLASENHFDGGRIMGWHNSGWDEWTDFYYDNFAIYTTDPGWGSSLGSCVDQDGDGFGPYCNTGPDCNDNNAQVHGTINCATNGNRCGTFTLCLNSCPADPAGMSCGSTCTPTGAEVCDGKDNDCDGQTDEGLSCGPSCTPSQEVCDGVDNDCDGTVDEGCGSQEPPSSTGDVNGDGVVDILDLVAAVNCMNGNCNGNEDQNSDGVVDILDLVIIVNNLG